MDFEANAVDRFSFVDGPRTQGYGRRAPRRLMSRRISSPDLVGRDAQIAVLRAAFEHSRQGALNLVVVKGDAGIGKTRLVRDFEHDPGCEELHVLRGACIPVGGEEVPYGPIVTALRHVDPDALETAVRGLPPAIAAEVRPLLPGLGDAPHASRDGSRNAQGRLYEYLLELLRRLGEDAPVLFIVEDLQWADQSTRAFLSFAARNGRRERVLVVATHRTHELQRGSALELYLNELERCDNVDSIMLSGLSDAEVRAQMQGILGRAPEPAALRRIAARTQGNPFYVEELVAAGAVAEVALPADHQAALLARVRALPAETQDVLRVLAAFGRPAPHRLLETASGIAEPTLSRVLRPAVEAHVVAIEEEDALTFRHALTREAVYEDLLPGEQRALHAGVARALYDHPEFTDAAELAVQWRAAGDRAAALAASVAAAQAAADMYAYGEAVEHYSAAVSLWSAQDARSLDLDRAAILLHAADAAQCAGIDQLPITWCLQGLEALGPDPEPNRAATFYERLGRFQDHHLDKSFSYYRQALECLGDEPSADRARLLSDESLALMLEVRWPEARERATEALRLARAAGARAEIGLAQAVLGMVLSYLGSHEEGEAHLEDAREIVEDIGQPDEVARVYVFLGEVRRLRGDMRGALRMMETGAQSAQRLGVEASYGRYLVLNAAEDQFELGQWPQAQARVESLDGAALTWSETLLRNTLLGQLACARGELETARRHLDRACEQLRPTSATEWIAYVHTALAELRIAEHDPDAALRTGWEILQTLAGKEEHLYTPALFGVVVRAAAEVSVHARAKRAAPAAAAAADTAERLLDRLAAFVDEQAPPTARAHLAGARAEAGRARDGAPVELWEAATAAWEALELPHRVAYARFRHAEALVAGPRDKVAAAAVLTPALATARELGAGPLLAEAEALAKRARLACNAAVPRSVEQAPNPLGLTDRELQVLELLENGATNQAIAKRLVISVATARHHVSSILRKLGAETRTEAAALARDARILTRD